MPRGNRRNAEDISRYEEPDFDGQDFDFDAPTGPGPDPDVLYDQFMDDCAEYGINPRDPHAKMLLVDAKRAR